MIIVTGGAGFIGSHLIQALNKIGYDHICVVDDLTDGKKIHNLSDLKFSDYLDCSEFYQPMRLAQMVQQAEVVFHQGANSSTTEWNGQAVMLQNYSTSKQILECCNQFDTPMIYASSASVYGNSKIFSISPENEHPLNPYAFSKWQFDRFVQAHEPFKCPLVGLRYFNVYGPREDHKGGQASPFTQFTKQYQQQQTVKVFEGSDHFLRDFVSVYDVVKVIIWMWQHRKSGIFNVGTGQTASFMDVANLISPNVETIPFPEHLKGAYQDYTCADLRALRRAGFQHQFLNIQEGYQKMQSELQLVTEKALV
ncbi:MAG: ADP-glyceromanno-heptose 6-epimerase [Legionellales bacterium]|nr:ADP-glyceromanno-heptose 6-epimerase [Legionellales bacterium]|tara:strand:- start:3220 stop:4146 length:927 start_codon:yes stop_codon:yes gene_type:complete